MPIEILKPLRRALVPAAAGLIALALGAGASAAATPFSRAAGAGGARRVQLFAQGDAGGDGEVAPAQIEKYVAVYVSMQRNRSLTIDRAAARQGLTVTQFRALERKIERDDSAREQAREELQSAAAGTKSSAPEP